MEFPSAFKSGFAFELLGPEQRGRVESLSIARPGVLSGPWRALRNTEAAALQARIDAMLHAITVPVASGTAVVQARATRLAWRALSSIEVARPRWRTLLLPETSGGRREHRQPVNEARMMGYHSFE